MTRFACLLVVAILSACTNSPETRQSDKRIEGLEKAVADAKPGLGEMMGVIREHHAKLFYSGKAQNWELAQYQIDELKEGFEDVSKFYPHFKEVKLALNELIPKIVSPTLEDVAAAIKKKDKKAFHSAFGALTESCNRCHQAAEHGFIVIQEPKSVEFTNQKFTP